MAPFTFDVDLSEAELVPRSNSSQLSFPAPLGTSGRRPDSPTPSFIARFKQRLMASPNKGKDAKGVRTKPVLEPTFPLRGSDSTPDLSDVAQLIKEGNIKNIIIMVSALSSFAAASGSMLIVVCTAQAGAGISTAAGMYFPPACVSSNRPSGSSLRFSSPDFRSPETGLYANLEKYQVSFLSFCNSVREFVS